LKDLFFESARSDQQLHGSCFNFFLQTEMKQNVKRVKKTARKSTQFAVEMDTRGIGFLLVLGMGAALLVFYLGYTFGKASRDPNLAVKQPAAQESEQETQTAEAVKKDLKIYGIKEEQGAAIDELKMSSQETLNDADRLISEAQKEPEPAPQPVPAEKPAPAKKADSFTPQWPDKAKGPDSDSGMYTFQIMASSDIKTADTMVRLLKQRGFDAYIKEHKVQGKLLYRVRVGRGSRSQLLAMEDKLKRVIAGGATPRIMRWDDQ